MYKILCTHKEYPITYRPCTEYRVHTRNSHAQNTVYTQGAPHDVHATQLYRMYKSKSSQAVLTWPVMFWCSTPPVLQAMHADVQVKVYKARTWTPRKAKAMPSSVQAAYTFEVPPDRTSQAAVWNSVRTYVRTYTDVQSTQLYKNTGSTEENFESYSRSIPLCHILDFKKKI